MLYGTSWRWGQCAHLFLLLHVQSEQQVHVLYWFSAYFWIDLEFYTKKFSVSKLVGLAYTIKRENASKGESDLYSVK